MKIDLRFDLPMTEALEFWRGKARMSPKEFYALAENYRVRAFTASRLARADMLDSIHRAIEQALNDGASFDQWQKAYAPLWEANGWTGIRAWRVDNIYRTNLQTAYNVGRYKQMMEVTEDRPYWQYSAVDDSRTRPTHRALHGRVYRYDSPFWDTFYPPNGFRCRCKVKTLSARQVEARGLEVWDGNGLGELIEPPGPNGTTLPARPLMPDKGFAGNPGKEAWHPDISKYPDWLRNKLGGVQTTLHGIAYRHSRTIDEARALAAELGTFAEYDSVNIGNYVNIGLVEAKAVGVKGPSSVRVDPTPFAENPDWLMAYRPGEDVLLLNPHLGLREMIRKTAEAGSNKYFSTSAPLHVIRHEIGHAMLYHAAPLRIGKLSMAAQLNPRVRPLVEKEVSEYAATNPLEFVAEVYAGLRDGRTYSDKIMRMYHAYGGV